jgi:hypothetical protein
VDFNPEARTIGSSKNGCNEKRFDFFIKAENDHTKINIAVELISTAAITDESFKVKKQWLETQRDGISTRKSVMLVVYIL